MLFNQQQCFIYSTASFLSKLRAKKVEKLHNSSFYRKFQKWNTGIGFRNRERLFPVLPIIIKKKIKLILTDRPQIFLTCDSKHTYIFFWPYLSHLLLTTYYFHLTSDSWAVKSQVLEDRTLSGTPQCPSYLITIKRCFINNIYTHVQYVFI